jgi:hypothetical protein
MARKQPARSAKKAKKQAKKKGASRPAARKMARKSSSKSAKKSGKKSAKRSSTPARAAKSTPAARKKQPARASSAPSSARATAGKLKKQGSLLASAAAAVVGSALAAGAKAAMGASKKPNLDRPRKTVADVHGIPSSLDMGRTASAARTGRAELKERLAKNTSATPALTAGDVDADWEAAESVGDEAPGGDNPTPDQDVVDDIGRALGVEYDDDEELQGGAEIADRDRNRWELDPSSKDEEDDEDK